MKKSFLITFIILFSASTTNPHVADLTKALEFLRAQEYTEARKALFGWLPGRNDDNSMLNLSFLEAAIETLPSEAPKDDLNNAISCLKTFLPRSQVNLMKHYKLVYLHLFLKERELSRRYDMLQTGYNELSQRYEDLEKHRNDLLILCASLDSDNTDNLVAAAQWRERFLALQAQAQSEQARLLDRVQELEKDTVIVVED